MLLKHTPKSLIGLDVHPQAIYLAQIKKLKRGFLLKTIEETEMPEDVMIENKIVHWQSFIRVLTTLLTKLGIHHCCAAISLPANKIKRQWNKLPSDLSDIEIYEQLKRDYAQHPEPVYLDFHVSRDKNDAYCDVDTMAVSKDYLIHYINALQSASLTLKRVDIDIYALNHFFSFVKSFNGIEDTKGILHQVKDAVLLIITQADKIIFYQHFHHSDFKIQYCLEPLSSVQRLFVTNQNLYRQLIREDPAIENFLQYENVFSTFNKTDQVQRRLNEGSLQNYILACGVALHEATDW